MLFLCSHVFRFSLVLSSAVSGQFSFCGMTGSSYHSFVVFCIAECVFISAKLNPKDSRTWYLMNSSFIFTDYMSLYGAFASEPNTFWKIYFKVSVSFKCWICSSNVVECTVISSYMINKSGRVLDVLKPDASRPEHSDLPNVQTVISRMSVWCGECPFLVSNLLPFWFASSDRRYKYFCLYLLSLTIWYFDTDVDWLACLP